MPRIRKRSNHHQKNGSLPHYQLRHAAHTYLVVLKWSGIGIVILLLLWRWPIVSVVRSHAVQFALQPCRRSNAECPGTRTSVACGLVDSAVIGRHLKKDEWVAKIITYMWPVKRGHRCFLQYGWVSFRKRRIITDRLISQISRPHWCSCL